MFEMLEILEIIPTRSDNSDGGSLDGTSINTSFFDSSSVNTDVATVHQAGRSSSSRFCLPSRPLQPSLTAGATAAVAYVNGNIEVGADDGACDGVNINGDVMTAAAATNVVCNIDDDDNDDASIDGDSVNAILSFDIDDVDSFNCGNDNGSNSGASANVDSFVQSVTNYSFRKFDVDDDSANVDVDD